MSDDEFHRVTEIERIANGKPTHFDMDGAFRARMHAAIAAGLESAPTSVITIPGTKKPQIRVGLNREIPSAVRPAVIPEWGELPGPLVASRNCKRISLCDLRYCAFPRFIALIFRAPSSWAVLSVPPIT